VPVFPLHTWLPDAHVQAPAAGSVILAGVLLKMGTFGFVRYAMPLFPQATERFAPLMGWLAVIGIVYGSLMSMAQTDMKKLIAYSSVAHLGYVVLGLFARTGEGASGAVLQMVNHGISTGALFLLVGMVYERTHTRAITDYGGIAAKMPVFTVFFIIVTMSSIGLPGTNGFAGEFLILSGAFLDAMPLTDFSGWSAVSMTCAAVATTGVLLGAIYMLSMVRRVFFGPITNPHNEALTDLNTREIATMLPLIVAIFWIGLYPKAMTASMTESVDLIVSGPGAEARAVRSQKAPEARTAETAQDLRIAGE
jgi:NADH-quinone oxidoreductase subunit M